MLKNIYIKYTSCFKTYTQNLSRHDVLHFHVLHFHVLVFQCHRQYADILDSRVHYTARGHG